MAPLIMRGEFPSLSNGKRASPRECPLTFLEVGVQNILPNLMFLEKRCSPFGRGFRFVKKNEALLISILINMLMRRGKGERECGLLSNYSGVYK